MFEQATERGYLLTDRKNAGLMNAWWARCTEKRKPYVKVKRLKQTASITVDLMPARRASPTAP